MNTIENSLVSELANRVAKEIELSSLAKKIAPQVAKRITDRLFAAIRHADIEELIAFMGESPKTDAALHAAIIRALNKLK